MAILNFVKPDKIVLQKANDFEAQFEFRPLEPGYGVTIGNALRRVLLNSLEGYAIIGINIVGADHEFATIKGITEDVTEILSLSLLAILLGTIFLSFIEILENFDLWLLMLIVSLLISGNL